MGWWDEGIMGGDTPLDFKDSFEERFGSLNSSFNEYRAENGHEPVPFVKPDPQDVVDFITNFIWHWNNDEKPILKQVVGFLVMERGAAMNDELRALVLEGIDNELEIGSKSWNIPELRHARLQEFRKIVEAYPVDGDSVEMPKSPGLFTKLAEKLGIVE